MIGHNTDMRRRFITHQPSEAAEVGFKLVMAPSVKHSRVRGRVTSVKSSGLWTKDRHDDGHVFVIRMRFSKNKADFNENLFF